MERRPFLCRNCGSLCPIVVTLDGERVVKVAEGVVRTGYNPLWMSLADMARLALANGDEVSIRSRHGEIVGFVEGDADMRAGVVAMTHGFGPKPGSNYDPRRDGSNVNLLLSWDDDPDPYHGMPRMSAVPVAIAVKEMVS